MPLGFSPPTIYRIPMITCTHHSFTLERYLPHAHVLRETCTQEIYLKWLYEIKQATRIVKEERACDEDGK